MRTRHIDGTTPPNPHWRAKDYNSMKYIFVRCCIETNRRPTMKIWSEKTAADQSIHTVAVVDCMMIANLIGLKHNSSTRICYFMLQNALADHDQC